MKISTLILILLTIALLPLQLPGASSIPRDIDEFSGTKVYMLGNSHTDSIREELAGLAGAAGKEYAYGTHTIPGAPLRWLYGHPGDSFEHLKEHAWDVVTLQSYNSTTEEEIQAAIDYTGLALQGNPDVHIIMYSIWPNEENWDEPTLGRREEWNEGVAQRIREAHPDVKVSVAPSSLVIRRVGNMADAGLIPGMNSRRDLYKDPGHMGPLGAYAINATMFSIIYDTSPLGLPARVMETSGGKPDEEDVANELEEATAQAIQRVVWDTLAQYPHDNVETGMVINGGYMPPALVGRAYEEPLPIINAPSEPEWTLISGELPPGLALENGKITGTATTEAQTTFTVKAQAAGETAEREIRIRADQERPLEIQTPETVELARDQYVMEQLESQGGIGRVTWSIADGALPHGFRLLDSGLLMGTPGEPGEFTVALQVQDQHPDGARITQKPLTFKVGPPSEGSIMVKRVTEEWVQDGKLDESFWSFDHPVRTAEGAVVGAFSVVYFEDPEDRRPKNTRDLLLAVKVAAASEAPVPTESVHLYLDMAHNREEIYNEDDVHYMVTRDGKDEMVQGYKGTNAFDEAVTLNDDGSWQMEVEISRKVFAGYGIHTTFGPNVTYGFSLAIGSIEDPAQRAYWRGDAGIDTDTTGFGTIVLIDPRED